MRTLDRIFVCALLGLLAGCDSGASSRAPDVLLVVVDTLRADHLSPYGYGRPTTPFLEQLAAEGVLCERVTAQAPWTRPSMVSVLSGQYLTSYRDHLREDAPSLPELFRAAGYRTIGISANQLITSEAGFARGFEYFDSRPPGADEDTSLPYRKADAVLGSLSVALERWLGEPAQHAADDQRAPVFVYLHLMDPHAPYAARAAYEGELTSEPDASGITFESQRERFEAAREAAAPAEVWGELAREVGRYDQELRYTDERISEAIEHCRRWGLVDDGVVALVADHGEGLWDHRDPRAKGERADDPRSYFLGGHGSHLHQELLATPMLLWGPGRIPAGVRIEAPVENIDLLPTLVELCGLSPPRRMDGSSLLPAMRGKPNPRPISFAHMMFASTALEHESGWKLVLPTREGLVRGWRPALYELHQDPRELDDRAASEPEVVARLTAAIETWRRAYPTPSSMAQRSDEELREMAALGYADLVDEMDD